MVTNNFLFLCHVINCLSCCIVLGSGGAPWNFKGHAVLPALATSTTFILSLHVLYSVCTIWGLDPFVWLRACLCWQSKPMSISLCLWLVWHSSLMSFEIYMISLSNSKMLWKIMRSGLYLLFIHLYLLFIHLYGWDFFLGEPIKMTSPLGS